MHILICEYFALTNDDTLPSYKSVRPSRCYSPRLEGINRLTELNQNNTTPSETNTTAHFTTVAHEEIVSETMYSDTPLNQEQLAYDEFPEHKYLYGTITWSSATTGNSLFTGDLIDAFLTGTASSAIGRKISNFLYFTADIKVTVVVQGFSTNYGKFVLWFDPTPYNVQNGNAAVSVPSAGTLHSIPQKVRSEQVPHIEIDPSKDATYQLTLKMPTITGCYSKAIRTGSYRYGGLVFNALNNGIGSTVPDVTMTVYLSLENVKLSTLTYTSSDIQTSLDFTPIPVSPIYLPLPVKSTDRKSVV